MAYLPSDARYASMTYNRCGRSGLKLPGISLGLCAGTKWSGLYFVVAFGLLTAVLLWPVLRRLGCGAGPTALPETFLLTVGGDHPRKNLDRLVQAWARVPAATRRLTRSA